MCVLPLAVAWEALISSPGPDWKLPGPRNVFDFRLCQLLA